MSGYLQKFTEPIKEEKVTTHVENHPFFIWADDKVGSFQDIHLDAMASYFNGLGIVESEYAEGFQKKLNKNQQKQMKKALLNKQASSHYPTNVFLGLQCPYIHSDIVADILGAVEELRVSERGFQKEKSGYNFDANIFGKHVMKHIQLVQDKNRGKYAYYNGMYYVLAENQYHQILSNFMREQSTVKWKRAYQVEYLAVMDNLVPICEATSNPEKKISLQNGYYDLEMNQFYSHNMDIRFFSQLNYAFDQNAKCPQFKRFLREIFEGDVERIQVIQEILGYIFWDGMQAQKLFIFLGNGANGKSVLAQIMTMLYGEQNVSSTPLQKLESSFGLQDLTDKWLNLAAENEQSDDINTEVLKSLSSGDRMLVNKKYQAPTTELLRTKLVLIMNNMFKTRDKTNGFYRRLIIIPFEKTFVEYTGGVKDKDVAYRDPKLLGKIAPEISGILNFALEGLQRLIENNWVFTSSQKCNLALTQYKTVTSPEEVFFERNLEYQIGHSIGKAEVTKKYRQWVDENEIVTSVSAKNINKKLDEYVATKSWSIERYKNDTDRIRNLKWKDSSNAVTGEMGKKN